LREAFLRHRFFDILKIIPKKHTELTKIYVSRLHKFWYKLPIIYLFNIYKNLNRKMIKNKLNEPAM
jgi:hypothetical protein